MAASTIGLEESIVTCESSYMHLEDQLAKCVLEAPSRDRQRLNHLASLMHEIINTHYGDKGGYEITMCAGEKSFALTMIVQ